jgi:hypothetical protein
MVPRRTPLAKTAAAAPALRLIYVPHGSIMKEWTPARTAPASSSRRSSSRSSGSRQLTVLTNLTNNGENGHSPSTGDVAQRHVSRQGQRASAEHDRSIQLIAQNGRSEHAVPVNRAGDRRITRAISKLRRRLSSART